MLRFSSQIDSKLYLCYSALTTFLCFLASGYFPVLFRCLHPNLSDVLLEFAEIDFLFKPIKRRQTSANTEPSIYEMGWTYNSSISPGVRRVTSGRMNQAIITETRPVPAKLYLRVKR